MALEKGKSGNYKGRPKGSPNKVTKDLRAMLHQFAVRNWPQVQRDFKKLTAVQRVALYEKLLKYVIPTLQETEQHFDIEGLSDEQITEMIQKIFDAYHAQLNSQTQTQTPQTPQTS